MRQELFDSLLSVGAPGSWQHVLDQFGMFCFTGLSKAQAKHLMGIHHIYLLPNGRINIAGLSSGNIPAVAKAIADATSNSL